MSIVRTTLGMMVAIALFASVAALALASPPNGNPAGGCVQGPSPGVGGGPPGGQYGPPGGQYGGPPNPPSPPSPPSPPGHQYGSPGSQYGGPGGNNGTPGGPNGCPPGGQYQYGP